MCDCKNVMMMFLGQFHWSVSIRCLQFTQICYHHIIRIEFCVQNWPLNVLHNIYGTRHIGTLKDNWMPLDIRCHSGDFQGCLHVVTVMKVSVLQACIIIDIIQWWKYIKTTNCTWKLSWRLFDDEMVDHIWINKYDLELGLLSGLIQNNELLIWVRFLFNGRYALCISLSHVLTYFCVSLVASQSDPFCITFFDLLFCRRAST